MDSLVLRKQQISLRHSILFFDDDILYNEILLLIIFNDRKRRLCFQKRLSVILSMGGGWTDPPGCRHGGSAQPPGYRHPFPLRQTSLGANPPPGGRIRPPKVDPLEVAPGGRPPSPPWKQTPPPGSDIQWRPLRW